ncbi:MAG: hypothetical protein ACOX5T_04770 [Candidatus Cryptobacteroides sp.]|jgi:hypothetical protein
MELDFGTIITLIILAVGAVLSVAGKPKKPNPLPEQWPEILEEDTVFEERTPETRREGAGLPSPTAPVPVSAHKAPAQPVRTDVHAPAVQEKKKLRIDKRNLILYSEIMKPKFDGQ